MVRGGQPKIGFANPLHMETTLQHGSFSLFLVHRFGPRCLICAVRVEWVVSKLMGHMHRINVELGGISGRGSGGEGLAQGLGI